MTNLSMNAGSDVWEEGDWAANAWAVRSRRRSARGSPRNTSFDHLCRSSEGIGRLGSEANRDIDKSLRRNDGKSDGW
ncbi:hypothetical protein P691DRAFT_805443 [Macrolepiota fuliginosa MF-IS2]|uniref:Uncharacterized protein n=1 Tax=Macrolepiota fuliginosa MF-IS2 TaxID=1400762 RepID=A0A9P6C1J8_9AGAR|nr:hypothetical protein P691DRAFT_805443 [Macrolepiota fuliginosa MF-IS2]